MQMVEAYPPAQLYADLPALLASLPQVSVTHLVYGTGPETDPCIPNLDVLHAARFAEVSNVEIHTFPDAGHAVVEWLIRQKQIDGLIADLLLPALTGPTQTRRRVSVRPVARANFRSFDDPIRAEIGEFLVVHDNRDRLLQILVERGYHPGEAQREIDKALRSPCLQTGHRIARRLGKALAARS